MKPVLIRIHVCNSDCFNNPVEIHNDDRLPIRNSNSDNVVPSVGENFNFPTPFGCQNFGRGSTSAPTTSSNFVKSLKRNRQANKVAENFLQLAGLSQSYNRI